MKFIKNISISFFLFTVGFVFLNTSCQNQLDEIRKQPNAITEIDDAALFTNGARSLFLGTTDEGTYRFAAHHAHYLVAGGEARKPDLYGDGFDTRYEGILNVIYSGVIKHIEDVLQITSTGATQNETRYAIADIISVMGFAKLTDAFGEIPYTEGGKGKTEGVLLPKYDTQAFIYADLIDRLTASIAVLKTADPANGYGVSDFIFENDLSKWVRFANSVRLRLAMRIRYADENLSRATVALCLNDPLMEDPSHDASMIETEGFGNNWYSLKTGWPGIKVSEMMVNQLTSTNDPRLTTFVAKDVAGGYSGQLNGLNDEEFGDSFWDDRSNMGDAISSEDSEHYIMTATETWFLRAEAALAYDNNQALANTNFRNGISTSFNQWNVPQIEADAFMATPTATLSGSTNQQEEQIGMQLWIAITPDYFESWANIRRSGHPFIAQRTDPALDPGVTNGYVPSRFKYSSFDLSTNGANTNEAIDRQGSNDIFTKIWWNQ